MMAPSVLEICAGAGGQALGFEAAGFEHTGLVEYEPDQCSTLRFNRPHWPVLETDLREFSGRPFRGVDVLAGGVPCQPFSLAGKNRGHRDPRDMFPEALRILGECRPRAFMFENVRGLTFKTHREYLAQIHERIAALGYTLHDAVLVASDYGVPQKRQRYIMVGFRSRRASRRFVWPRAQEDTPSLGSALYDIMASQGWPGAELWALETSQKLSLTIIGGAKKRGGPDLGPRRTKQSWLARGIDPYVIGNRPPGPEHPVDHLPRLTIPMLARLQGFPDEWAFAGCKSSKFRQIGNAMPPAFAEAIAMEIRRALR